MVKKNFYHLIFLISFFALLMVFPSDMDAQCAMCKQAAETSLKSNPNSIARSLNTGILYLMAVPYLLIMFIFRKQIVQLLKRVFKKQTEAEIN